MQEFLTQRPICAAIFISLVIFAALFLFVKLMQTIGMEKVREYVYKLFIEAEHEFKHGQNEEKFNYVILYAKSAVPTPFNLFISEKSVRKVIQLWFNLCKDLLDDGKLNGTGKDE